MVDAITHYALYRNFTDFPTEATLPPLSQHYDNNSGSLIGCILPDLLYLTGVLEEQFVHSVDNIDTLKTRIDNIDSLRRRISPRSLRRRDLLYLIHGMENHIIADDISHNGNEFLEYLRNEAKKELARERFSERIIESDLPDFLAETIFGGYLKENNPEILDYMRRDQQKFINNYVAGLVAEMVLIWERVYDLPYRRVRRITEQLNVIGSIEPDDFGSIEGFAKVWGQVYGVRKDWTIERWKEWMVYKTIFSDENKVGRLRGVEKKIINRLKRKGIYDEKLAEVFTEMQAEMTRYYVMPEQEQHRETRQASPTSLHASPG